MTFSNLGLFRSTIGNVGSSGSSVCRPRPCCLDYSDLCPFDAGKKLTARFKLLALELTVPLKIFDHIVSQDNCLAGSSNRVGDHVEGVPHSKHVLDAAQIRSSTKPPFTRLPVVASHSCDQAPPALWS